MSALGYSLKTYRSAIAIATICLMTAATLAANDMALAQNRRSKYGLGSLPETAKTSGGTRRPGELSRIVVISPDDGALAFSDRPTFYWYIVAFPGDPANTPFEQEFLLQQRWQKQNPEDKPLVEKIFNQKATTTKPGLYRVTLPPTGISLIPNVDRQWKIRLHGQGENSSNFLIRMENKPAAIAELSKAKTDLEKARIYERYGYWYDAFDAYTRWLEVNPKDKVARRERANMIEIGLKDNRDFSDNGQPNLKLLSELQSKIDTSVATDLAPHTVENKP
jgi:hypothetical protein